MTKRCYASMGCTASWQEHVLALWAWPQTYFVITKAVQGERPKTASPNVGNSNNAWNVNFNNGNVNNNNRNNNNQVRLVRASQWCVLKGRQRRKEGAV